MKKVIFGVSAAVLATPLLAFAQTSSLKINTSYTDSITGAIGNIVTVVVPILVGLAVVYFLWGVVKYIMSAGDPEKEKEARGIMIYGVIGIFVMVSLWGLVAILQNIFNAGSGTAMTLTPPPMNNSGSGSGSDSGNNYYNPDE